MLTRVHAHSYTHTCAHMHANSRSHTATHVCAHNHSHTCTHTQPHTPVLLSAFLVLCCPAACPIHSKYPWRSLPRTQSPHAACCLPLAHTCASRGPSACCFLGSRHRQTRALTLMEILHGPLRGAAPDTSLQGQRPLGVREVSVLFRPVSFDLGTLGCERGGPCLTAYWWPRFLS